MSAQASLLIQLAQARLSIACDEIVCSTLAIAVDCRWCVVYESSCFSWSAWVEKVLRQLVEEEEETHCCWTMSNSPISLRERNRGKFITIKWRSGMIDRLVRYDRSLSIDLHERQENEDYSSDALMINQQIRTLSSRRLSRWSTFFLFALPLALSLLNNSTIVWRSYRWDHEKKKKK